MHGYFVHVITNQTVAAHKTKADEMFGQAFHAMLSNFEAMAKDCPEWGMKPQATGDDVSHMLPYLKMVPSAECERWFRDEICVTNDTGYSHKSS